MGAMQRRCRTVGDGRGMCLAGGGERRGSGKGIGCSKLNSGGVCAAGWRFFTCLWSNAEIGVKGG